MQKIKIKDDNHLIKLIIEVAKDCRKGSFIYIVCRKKMFIKKIRETLALFRIVNKRGIYTYKGIVVIDLKYRKDFIKYFNKVFIYE